MKPFSIATLLGGALVLSLGMIGMTGCSSTTTDTDGGKTEGGTSEGGGSDGGGGMCATTTTCKAYCDQLTSACSGANVQLDNATCTSLCKALTNNEMDMGKLGKVSDAMGDTIGCREYHSCVASMSAANAAMHCGHSNIWSAGDTCGTQCDAFCAIETKVCTGANAQFAGMNECLSKCGQWMAGKPTDTAGDTLGCREYHLGVASTSDANAAMHCPHTGNGPADGGGNPVCK